MSANCHDSFCRKIPTIYIKQARILCIVPQIPAVIKPNVSCTLIKMPRKAFIYIYFTYSVYCSFRSLPLVKAGESGSNCDNDDNNCPQNAACGEDGTCSCNSGFTNDADGLCTGRICMYSYIYTQFESCKCETRIRALAISWKCSIDS